MTKRQSRSDDWSRASEALFQSARTDFAPSTADRERVRGALAQRLTETAGMPAIGGNAQSAGAAASAVGKLVKIGIGVAIAAAGAIAFMRAGDGDRREPPPSAAISPPPALATPGVRAEVPAELREPPAARSETASEAKPRVAAAARAHQRRSRRERSVAAAPTLAPAPAPSIQASPSATLSASRPIDEPRRTAVESAQQSANTGSEIAVPTFTPAASAAAVVRDPAPAAKAAPEETSNDARAELTWMAKIDAAMRQSRLSTVVSLCAEHARRWPRGAFVQEREALGAIAACRSGARNGEALAVEFFRSYPRAPLAPRVAQACAPRTPKDLNRAR